MAEQMRPASKEQAPDPSFNYERSHPDREAGMGRLDTNRQATPAKHDDKMKDAITHAQDPTRQINAQDEHELPKQQQPDHSMKDEEPMGWDQAPMEAQPNEMKRHPRVGGKGGTPDAGDQRKNS